MTVSHFDEIVLGDQFRRELHVTDDLMASFQIISGDDNLLHTEVTYAHAKGFKGRVAYGNLIGLMVSSLVGVEMSRFEVMLVSQQIIYRKPVYVGDKISMCGTITSKLDAMKVAELKIEVRKQDGVSVATGKVQVVCL